MAARVAFSFASVMSRLITPAPPWITSTGGTADGGQPEDGKGKQRSARLHDTLPEGNRVEYCEPSRGTQQPMLGVRSILIVLSSTSLPLLSATLLPTWMVPFCPGSMRSLG